MKIWKNILISLVIVNIIISPCLGDDPTLLQKDQAAPYNGLLFSQEKAQELRNGLLERDTLKSLNESLEKSLFLKNDTITLLQSQRELLNKDNNELAKNLHDERTANKWSNFGYFLLGVLGTLGALYGATQISR